MKSQNWLNCQSGCAPKTILRKWHKKEKPTRKNTTEKIKNFVFDSDHLDFA